MKNRLWLSAFALLISACATQQNPPQTAAAEAPKPAAAQVDQAALERANHAAAENALQAIAAAEASVRRADSVGFAWRDSESMLKEARQAAEKKDFGTAEKLATTARLQGDLAYRQYLDQTATLKR